MKRIIITAILTVICAVGAATSFVVNDLPNYGEWMKTNEQQFRKPPKHDGPDKHIDKHHMKDNSQMMPQDGMEPNNGDHMPQNGQMHAPAQNGQMAPQGQPMPPQGQPSQQPNGNAPQPPMEQGAPQTTQDQ